MKPEPKDAQRDQATSPEILEHEQEELAGVDTTIRQTVAAMESGRNAIAGRINPSMASGSNPVEVVKAGRQQVVRKIHAPGVGGTEQSPDTEWQLTRLNTELANRLSTLTSDIGHGDRLKRQIVESQIRSSVSSYLSSVRRILNPLRFTSDFRDQQTQEREKEENPHEQ